MPPAIRDTHRQRPGANRRFVIALLQQSMQVVLLFFIFSSLIGRFEIRQTSMEPNFHEGERVIVNQFGSALSLHFGRSAYAATGSQQTPSTLRRGQVIVFYETPGKDTVPLIKRLIALPGDTIELRSGAVYVNGVHIEEPYVHGSSTLCSVYCGPLTLGEEEYFFMGDNRSVSRDSRHFGPIAAEQIVGHVILRYWPLEQLQLLP